MPGTATMVGALLGLGVRMYSNALQKLPYMHHQWEHALGMSISVVFASQMAKWETKLKEDLDKIVEKASLDCAMRKFATDIEALLSGLSAGLAKLQGNGLLRWDFEGRAKVRDWLVQLAKMGSHELTEQQARRFHFRIVSLLV